MIGLNVDTYLITMKIGVEMIGLNVDTYLITMKIGVI
jgi:hypothetical protein